MAVAHLLVDRTRRFMHQPNIVILVSNHNGIEIWKDLKISDHLIVGKVPYF